MAKQTFTTGQVLTAAQMTSLQQTAMGGGSPVTKTASYVLVAADAGTVIQMNSASATTITVNTALFAAGDSVQIQNIGAGVCTITAGTATVTTAGSLALSQWEGGSLYFTSTSASIFFDIVQGAAGGMTLLSTTTLSGTSTTVSSIDQTYTNLYVLVTNATTVSSATYVPRFNPNGTSGLALATSIAGAAVLGVTEFSANPSAWAGTSANALSILVNNYASTTQYKTVQMYGSSAASAARAFFVAGLLNTTSAITSIAYTSVDGIPTFNAGTMYVYGVK
jgi:hypothetical protein